jgi:hypothetical protein
MNRSGLTSRTPPTRLACCIVLLTVVLLSGCGQDDPQLPLPSIVHNYQYGEVISFRAGGDSARFRTSGWAAPEPSGTWTDGPSASLTLRIARPTRNLLLSMTLQGHVSPPRLPQQTVELYVNREKLATWQVGQLGGYTAIIPGRLAERGLLVIDLHVPQAVSPAELGTSADQRRLGVLCTGVVVSESTSLSGARLYNPGSVVYFGSKGQSEDYRVQGWSITESEATWTEGRTAVLDLQIISPQQPLTLRARIAGMTQPPTVSSQPTDVYANGELIAHWDVSGTPADYHAPLSPEVMSRSSSLRLEFKTPAAISPKAVGASEDARVLGLLWFELQLIEDR